MAKILGVIGGGQLGLMLTEAANQMSEYISHVIVLDPTPNCPASKAGAKQIIADFKDEDAILELAEKSAKHAETNHFKAIIAGAGGAAHLPGMIASHTVIPVIGVPIMVYNDKQKKGTDKTKFSAFGGLDSLLSISEMPSGSPVVTVGVNKAANAAIYSLKILANEYPEVRNGLKKHKENQHDSVLKESEQMKKVGLSRFVKQKFKSKS